MGWCCVGIRWIKEGVVDHFDNQVRVEEVSVLMIGTYF